MSKNATTLKRDREGKRWIVMCRRLMSWSGHNWHKAIELLHNKQEPSKKSASFAYFISPLCVLCISPYSFWRPFLLKNQKAYFGASNDVIRKTLLKLCLVRNVDFPTWTFDQYHAAKQRAMREYNFTKNDVTTIAENKVRFSCSTSIKC